MPSGHYIDPIDLTSVFPIGPGDQHSLARPSFTELLRVFRGVEVTSGDHDSIDHHWAHRSSSLHTLGH